MARPFVHLHVHSHYSLLDGACKVPDLVKRVKALGMDSVAITDHGAMYGAIEFFNECKKEGIRPIVGIEAYMAPGARTERTVPGGNAGEAAYHLVLLVENIDGYRNLMKLASTAYRDGFYYKPRIDKEILKELKGGLIATSACLGGEIPSAFLKRDAKAAKQVAETYLEIFGPDRFFIEIQKQGIKEQDEVNPELVELARRLGCGVVATNDVHFLNKDDHFAHDVLCCISMGKQVTDEGRLKYPKELYLKSPAEMAEALGRFPEAMENTARIAQMCNLDLSFTKKYAPVYKVPPEKLREGSGVGVQGSGSSAEPRALNPEPLKDDERYLRQLCEDGLKWRYGDVEVKPEIRQRLDYELKVIASKNFCSYFLIVWDFCNYARSQGIPVGARGSGVGTMVGYLLGLCNVDPIRYGLLFERFMDPSRNEMPDIDIDICQDGRQKVIDYVRQKYGHVAQIITFGTLAARAACKDVARVLGVPLAEVDKITKLIPGTPGMTLKKALDGVPDLAALYDSNPQTKQVIDIAQRLEGLCRNAGVHAAGVIIADRPIEDIAPLCTDKDDNILTQFEGPIAEKVGLLKMDFLGLRTLSTLQRAIDLEFQTRAARGGAAPVAPLTPDGKIDIERIDFADKNVLAMFCRGETKGIFQFESGGMQDLLMKMQPDRLEDLIAANALYRPGPMELIPLYCNRKHGREEVPKVHPIMDKILEETWGIMVYQEQVMQIFNQLGGIELANAYKLIKAIGKKQTEIIAKFKPDFIRGTVEKGVSQDQAEELFELIKKFGGYGFNKCVVGATTLVDARTGERTTVGELFAGHRPFTVHALGEDGKLRPRAVTDVVRNGRKRVFELRTAQGKRITATANHPFHTLTGWKTLGELRVGDRIGAPRALRVPAHRSWPRHEVIALAGLLSEGNTCHPSCLYFFGNEPRLVNDFARAAEAFPDSVAHVYSRRGGRMEACISTGRNAHHIRRRQMRCELEDGAVAVAEPRSVRSGAFRWAEALGIVGVKATAKRVPKEVFELCDGDLELFLGRLWAGDGFLANATNFVPYYATSSRQLAHDVQTLLLRLGIISGVHAKSFKYRGGIRPGYTVHLLGEESTEVFARSVGPHCLGREAQLGRLTARLRSTERGRTSKDTVPAEVRAWVDNERKAAGLTWRQLDVRSDVSMKEFVGRGSAGKRGFRRSTIASLARFFGSQRLADAATSDIFWDRVTAIELQGIQDTYDLTVEHDHNFVADGLIVHNSHSTRYAIVAFQTAYMKVYHSVEYMSALLTYEMGSTEKVVEYIEECRRMTLPDGRRGLTVLPPDVNYSDKDFTPIYEEAPQKKRAKAKGPQGVIRFGLCAVRGVGQKAVEGIIEERKSHGPFASLYDFCERVDTRYTSRTVIDALIKCGAFSSQGARRSQLLAVLDAAVEAGQQSQADKRMGQLNMFGGPAASSGPRVVGGALPNIDEYENAELLKFEKELLGFYITSHPLTQHQSAIERYSTASTRQAMASSEGSDVLIGGMINRVKTNITKAGRSAGQKMAWITLEDLDGSIDGVIWAETLTEITQKYPDAISAEKIVFVKGRVDKKRETPSLQINEVIPVEEAVGKFTTSIVVKLDPARHNDAVVSQLKPLLGQHKGRTPVFAQVPAGGGQWAVLRLGGDCQIRPSAQLVEDLERVLGAGQVALYGAGSKRKRQAQQQLFPNGSAETEAPAEPAQPEMELSMQEEES